MSHKLASRVTKLHDLGVDRMGDEADAARDPRILRLENLDTDLRPPIGALAATTQAVEEDAANSYLPFQGGAALRQAATSRVSRQSGQSYDPQESCLITAGGLSGILDVLLTVIEPGEKVLLTDPIYIGLLNRVSLAGGVAQFISYRPHQSGWRLDLDELRSSNYRDLRAVLLANPSMPTGAVLNREEWEAVAQICREQNAWLIYDAALENIVYDGVRSFHPASLPGMAERTVTVGSVSKEYRMIGWRVGWVIGPPDLIHAVGKVHMANSVTPVGIAQSGAAAALASGEDDLSKVLNEWQKRRDVMLQELGDLPVVRPNGGWCMLLDNEQLGIDSTTASRRLLEVGQIATTPMVHWGRERSDHYVRFVFSNEPCSRLLGMGSRVRTALVSALSC